MSVSVTNEAATHIESYLQTRGAGLGIRLAVKTTGCSGLTYVLEPVDELREEDLKFSSRGVDVYVDPKSLIYLDGTEMDYVKRGLSEGFGLVPGLQGILVRRNSSRQHTQSSENHSALGAALHKQGALV